jgi:MoxR-like ATPase
MNGSPSAAAAGVPASFGPNRTREWFQAICTESAKAVLGQSELIEQLLITVLCREHALLEGPAGTAKWSAVEALGKTLGLSSWRIRCSPDLTPDDLLGRSALTDPWRYSLLLVDNVDVLAAKVRNIVQQAMCDRVVDTREERHAVPDPFVVFATRYRSEQPPSPELADPYDDRFMFQIEVSYPSYHQEYSVAAAKSRSSGEHVGPVLAAEQLESWRSLVPRMEAPPSVVHYAVRLVRATRVHEGENPDFIYEWVHRGASPRAAHYLVLAAKARATLVGRTAASHDDVQAMCRPVLRHRILVNQNARIHGIGADRVIQRLVDEVPPRIVGDESIPAPGESFTFHDWIAASDDGD